MTDKRSIRRECFARIKEMPEEDRRRHSEAISRHLAVLPEFGPARRVHAYLAMPTEPDLSALFRDFPEKEWAFSRVRSDGEQLIFHRVDSMEKTRIGDFGFLEPDPDCCPEAGAPDLVLVPGVAFDPASGARLGRGKGHYDRYFAGLAPELSCHKVGICFSPQLTALDPEAHDVPMDRIVSETGALS